MVPKQKNATVSTITVTNGPDRITTYQHAILTTSLWCEPAQTYTLRQRGNLRATTSIGRQQSDETFQYDGADLTKQVAGGYGT
ncbi:MAG: hypothetical protein ACLU9S_22820 [Oscillospiraceae bacterium]